MASAGDRRVVVCDTSVLINFLVVDRLDLLARNPEFRFVLTEHVRAEVIQPDQRAALDAAVASDDIAEIALDVPEALRAYAELAAVLGRGESAAIALAKQRGWIVAIDERGRARREVDQRLGVGKLVTTAGILVGCIENGVLNVADADAIKARLEQNRFVMPFRSFADVIAPPRQGT